MFSWEDEIISTTKTRYFLVKCNLCCKIFTSKLKKVKLYCQQVGKTENYVSVNKLPCTTRQPYVGDRNMHLQQKALIEKCSVNKDVRSEKICYALHCYTPVIKILEKYLSRASNLLDLQGSNLQLYSIRGVSEHQQKTFIVLSEL